MFGSVERSFQLAYDVLESHVDGQYGDAPASS